MPPKTMFEKIWDAHLVHGEEGQPAILYVDLHLVHEVTSAQALEGRLMAGRKVPGRRAMRPLMARPSPTKTPKLRKISGRPIS